MATLKYSRQRESIKHYLATTKEHPTADAVYLHVKEEYPNISLGTVYRNLGVLSENEEITNVKVPAADRYDSHCDRHYHIFCTGCGRVFDAPLPYRADYD